MSNTVERAFELARSGECATTDEIRQRLRLEKCDQVEAHLAGRYIQYQLRSILTARPDIPIDDADGPKCEQLSVADLSR